MERIKTVKTLFRMITKHRRLMHAIGLCDDTNSNMSDRVKIPHMPYHICVHTGLFLCIDMPAICMFVYVWDSVTFQQWEQAWGWCGKNMAVLPLWKLHSSAAQRVFCHENEKPQFRDWAGGSGKCVLGDNVPTAKLTIYKDSITFSHLLRCKVLHTPCYLVGAGH